MPNDKASATGYIVGGIVAVLVLRMVRDLFGGIGSALGINTETSKEKDRAQAAIVARARDFSDPGMYPELWRATPLLDLARAGGVTAAQLERTRQFHPVVVQAAVNYHDAKGMIVDNEEKAVSAIGSIPTYLALLWLADTFAASYVATLGAYGETFLEARDKAAICNLIDQLRST